MTVKLRRMIHVLEFLQPYALLLVVLLMPTYTAFVLPASSWSSFWVDMMNLNTINLRSSCPWHYGNDTHNGVVSIQLYDFANTNCIDIDRSTEQEIVHVVNGYCEPITCPTRGILIGFTCARAVQTQAVKRSGNVRINTRSTQISHAPELYEKSKELDNENNIQDDILNSKITETPEIVPQDRRIDSLKQGTRSTDRDIISLEKRFLPYKTEAMTTNQHFTTPSLNYNIRRLTLQLMPKGLFLSSGVQRKPSFLSMLSKPLQTRTKTAVQHGFEREQSESNSELGTNSEIFETLERMFEFEEFLNN